MLCHCADQKLRSGKISELFVYDNFSRVAAEEVDAGDICAVTGLSDVGIGETICSREQPEPLPTITVQAPLPALRSSLPSPVEIKESNEDVASSGYLLCILSSGHED